MTTWKLSLAVAAIAVVATVVVLAFARPLLAKWQIVDRPNARSSHARPVLRGGGVGPGAGAVLGVLVGVAIGGLAQNAVVLVLWAGAVSAFALLGGLEDVRGMSVRLRASAQLMLAVLTVASVAASAVDTAWWLAAGSVVAIVAFVNAANFMDGLNGLSSLFAAVAGLSYVGLGLVIDMPWLVAVGVAVAAAFLAFLPWNAVNPRLFLGDVGSYALGAAIGVAAVAAAFLGAPVPAVVAPVLIYVVDTGYTLVKRVRAGERWYEAHRSHVYQRLNQAGWSHLGVAAFVATASGLCGAAGLLWAAGGEAERAVAAVAAAAVAIAYVQSPRLLARSHRVAPRITSNGGASAGRSA